MTDDWEYRVRHRAYELWNEAGRPDGKHLQFWEAAVQELKRLDAPANGASDGAERRDDAPAAKPAGGA